MTIRDFLDNSVDKFPGRTAQRFYEQGQWKVRTYSELREIVMRAAIAIGRLGIKPGRDNVALMMDNSPSWEIAYLALSSVGITVVPMNPKLCEREALHILSDSQSVVILADGNLADLVFGITGNLPDLKYCLFTDLSKFKGMVPEEVSVDTFAALAASPDISEEERKWFETTRPSTDDVASILYTSGTTGVPKGVMLTHGNFEANADFAKHIIPFSESDDFLVLLPLFHVFSFAFTFLVPLYVGGCSSFVRSLKTISDDIRTIRPTTILAVPLLAEKMYAKIDSTVKSIPMARFLDSIGLSRLIGKKVRDMLGGRVRILAIGGAPTSRKAIRGLRKFGIPAVEGYGLTECGPLVSFSPVGAHKIGTVGRILPCMTYKVCDKDKTGAGELRVKGPNVMKGYFRNRDASARAFDKDGFLHTGDIVRVDSHDNITICGRDKAMIVNREGKNIYPEEIEQVVNKSPLVLESVSVGYSIKGETGERVGLIVVPNAEECKAEGIAQGNIASSVRKAITEICRTSLAEYKIPRKIVIRDKPLEHTSTMKVRRIIYKGALDE